MTATTSMHRYSVPFGRGSVEFAVPPNLAVHVVEPPPVMTVADPAKTATGAIRQPIGSPPLRELARGKCRVVIAVTDATRACPDHLLVPPMLEEIAAAGVPDEAVTLIVAVGAHRASTDAEKREKLGAAIVERYRIVDHDAGDETSLLAPPVEVPGIAVRLNREVLEADLLLATGIVEPHQYAGYSGGGKTVAIGCANFEMIVATHGPAMLEQPGTRLAQIDGNPFQTAVRRVARAANLAFVGNAVMDSEGRLVEIAYGAPEAVHDALVRTAGSISTVAIDDQVDIAIAGVGYPKDANLYQASRAASYLHFAPVPVVRRGGAIIVPAACPEGAGDGVGERAFFAAMSDPGGPAAVIEQARRDGIRPGQQRAYVMARVLQEVRVIIAGSDDPAIAAAMGLLTAPAIEAAIELAQSVVAGARTLLIVPHALHTLPVVTRQPAIAGDPLAI